MPPTDTAIATEAPPSGHFNLWIEAGHVEKHYWFDLWRYRELFYILAWRDIMVRYKQTVAGAAWAILQPLFTMLIMVAVFHKIAGLSSVGDAPYAIMTFAALLPWQFFSSALQNASQSVIGNANMISKVYFPRIIIPSSAVMVSLADFLVSFVILGGLMVWFQYLPTWRILTLPLFTLLAIVTAMGPGLLITALTVRFRDFRFIIPFIVQFGMFVSPVGYSSQSVKKTLVENLGASYGDIAFSIYSLNPLVGVIDGFRWAILGENPQFFSLSTVFSIVIALLLFFMGVSYFRKTERSFADTI